MIKAIETRWRGFRFRSRTEARWGVFFDALGVRWEYEREGYTFDALRYMRDGRAVEAEGGRYLPDFWIEVRGGLWAEVKGAAPTEHERTRCELLALGTNEPVLLLEGAPAPVPYEIIIPRGGAVLTAPFPFKGPRAERALGAARSARFEHGETPR